MKEKKSVSEKPSLSKSRDIDYVKTGEALEILRSAFSESDKAMNEFIAGKIEKKDLLDEVDYLQKLRSKMLENSSIDVVMLNCEWDLLYGEFVRKTKR